MEFGSSIVHLDDGYRFYWLCLAVWTDVIVGSNSDYKLVLGYSIGRSIVRGMGMGRFFGG